MIICKCGAKFENIDEWRGHRAALCPPYPFHLAVERGQITSAQFLKMKRAYEDFVETHIVIKSEENPNGSCKLTPVSGI